MPGGILRSGEGTEVPSVFALVVRGYWQDYRAGWGIMVEPPFAAPSEVASERDVLLATKLHVPRPRPDLVPRPQLAERLDRGLACGLVLVCAPAGYGKTVLLADWARRGQQPVAWLSLDAGDNDPARFWRHAVAALDQMRPGLAERVGSLLGPPAPSSYQGLVTALINELAAGPDADQALLVLDDYHLIESQAVHASLEFLLEHRPPGLHLVLASRSDPPLALARLRGRGQLTELRAAELRFTRDEAAALLRQGATVSGVALPETAVAALAARTEGWAAGLQLAALSLRGQPDAAGFTAAFTGSHRFILDFLAEEVLEQQSDQVRTFLLETSVLERLSGELCDAVTGRPGSQALLEQVERAGLFVVPLDEVRGWWRYHHLFADLLRARLQQEQPGRAALLHRNAAAWYDDHEMADDAIRHAVAAGEMAWAARLIEQHFDERFYLRGEGVTVQRWLSALPGDLVRTRPRLLLAQALLAFYSGRTETEEPLLDAAEQAYASPAGEPFEPTVGRAGSMLVNVPALIAIRRGLLAQLRGDAEDTAAFASRALAESREGEWLLSSTARRSLAVAEWLRGQLTEAEHAFAASIAGWQATGQPALTAWPRYQLAQVQRALGRLDAATQTYEQALSAAAVPGRPPAPTVGLVYVGMAEVAYQRNELDSALRYVTEGIALERQFLPGTSPAAGLATLAWIRQAVGDPAGALEAMGEAGHAAPATAGVLNPYPAQRARLLLAQGDVAAAARWTQETGLHAEDEPRYPREPGYLVLARVLLSQQRPAEALALLDRLYAAAVAQKRVGSVIEAGALRALALAACGEDAEAVNALADVLTLACPQGYVRVFADEGPPMAALLGRLIAAQRSGQAAVGVPLGCLARLQRAFDVGHTGPGSRSGTAPAAVPGLVEQLTSRELEVLGMLAAGKSNQAIADQLVVTLDTVKKHVSHLLGKLAAANRTEAVTRARELGLIP
ncbi:MAG: LuxR C-terminal-related transcriptional regulator [Trebonia sp.]|uniref:LuxR C-terminal-related transcriptional regulator n=1 Tax=Trebonia sp. TaxID=2767075 RepID=UPI003BB03C56